MRRNDFRRTTRLRWSMIPISDYNPAAMTGKTLGPYKILEPLGAGGMGEVYLAEDTRLKRKIANSEPQPIIEAHRAARRHEGTPRCASPRGPAYPRRSQ